MKYLVLVLPLLLVGCVSRSGTTVGYAPSRNSNGDAHLIWSKIENLTGEPLVDSLISYGDIDLAELKELRRNVRLEIAALALESKEHHHKDVRERSLTGELQAKALERKMTLWKAVQKNESPDRTPLRLNRRMIRRHAMN